jgi:hypothetical protein
MSILLSSTLVNKTDDLSKLNIVYTDGTTYNMDTLLANRTRSTSEAALTLEVKDEQTIATSALTALKKEVGENISTTFNTETIKTAIFKIIEEVHEDLGLPSTTYSTTVTKMISRKISTYLASVYNQYKLDYTVTVTPDQSTEATSISILVSYKFAIDNDLLTIFSNYYDSFEKKYLAELSVSTGGLAISNKNIVLTATTDDYKKYLFNNIKSTESYSEPGVFKPLVLWSDGTDDETTALAAKNSVYEKIVNINSRLTTIDSDLQNTKSNTADGLDSITELVSAIKQIQTSAYASITADMIKSWSDYEKPRLVYNAETESYDLVGATEVTTNTDETYNIDF